MNIYTRTGDAGTTHLFAGARVRKDHARIEACGEVDELNCLVGVIRAETTDGPLDERLNEIQLGLLNAGAQIASPDPGLAGTELVTERLVSRVEAWIDEYEAELPALKWLILPGGTRLASHLHLARAVCRRAERRLVSLIEAVDEDVSGILLQYLNRLSDLLFVLARSVNHAEGISDHIWRPE